MTDIRTAHDDDIERIVSKEKEAVGIDTQYAGEESAEYQDFIRLSDMFQGINLRRLHTDWHVIPPLIAIYLMTYIDRSNVGNAKLFGAQEDLGLNGTQWNIGLALLFITYAIGSPITNALVKIYSAKWVLPICCMGCGVTIIAAGCSSNEAAWYSLRLLLGLFEGGIYSACAYALTTWYDPGVLASRFSFFYLGGTASGGFSGLLAYGIGQLDGHWGYRGWRWIYVLEGFVSVCLGAFSLWWIQSDPEKKHSWLTEDEQRFIILRNKFGYGADKSGSTLLGFKWQDFISAVKSPHNWIIGMANFAFCTLSYAFSFTLPTIVKNMGFTAATAQALSAPPYFISMLSVIGVGLLTDKYKRRCLSIAVPSFVAFIGMIICMTTAAHKNLVALTYIACVITACGFFPLTPIISSFAAIQNAGQTKRAAALSLGIVFTQLGGVLGSNIFLAEEAPTYKTGFGTSMALVFVGCVLMPIFYWFYIGRINAKRDAMSEDEIREKYSPEELEAMGDRSPYYRYER